MRYGDSHFVKRGEYMKGIVCLDDAGGMLFGGRRQSRDRIVLENILSMSDGGKLYIHSFSKDLFSENDVIVDDMLLEKAGEEDFCFIENLPLKAYAKKLSKLVVFYWNRKYPADFVLDIDLADFREESREDLRGNSHEKITKVVYSK